MKNKINNYFKIIFINILVLFFLLALFELGLRLFWKMSTLKGELYMASKNRILRYEMRPNAFVGNVKTNSDGFRDKQYSVSKPEHAFRVIVLGDSETFSKALPLADTMPKQLEQVFNLRCTGKTFEVFNMGVEGYNSIQELEFLKYKGLKYNPDLVILYYCFNDPDYPEYYFKKSFLNRNFLLSRYIQYRIKKFLVKRDRKRKNIKTEEENFRYLYSGESWDYTKDAISELSNLSKEKGFKFVLVVVPETSSAVLDFRDNYPYWYINEKLANLKNSGVEVIDPIYLFKKNNYNPLGLVINREDRHKNTKANFLIVSYIHSELKKRAFIPCK